MFSDTELSETDSIEVAKAAVEDALRKLAQDTTIDAELSWIMGKLSTNPTIVDPNISTEEFLSRCGTFSRVLQEALARSKFMTDLVQSADEDNNAHRYLQTILGVELLIDPSIGQFLDGHRHVFVGTRDQLRRLVLEQTGDQKPYKIINTRSRNNPVEAFERTWGNTSIIKVPARQALEA